MPAPSAPADGEGRHVQRRPGRRVRPGPRRRTRRPRSAGRAAGWRRIRRTAGPVGGGRWSLRRHAVSLAHPPGRARDAVRGRCRRRAAVPVAAATGGPCGGMRSADARRPSRRPGHADDHRPGRRGGRGPPAARDGRGGARPATITAIVNIGDDTDLHGLHISPDLDTVMYTLADAINPETGWGLAGETWRVMESLGRLGRGHLVQPRRPGPGHPLLPDPAPGRGRPARDGHRRAGRPLRRGRPAGAGDRRPAAHPAAAGRRRRGRVPGVLRQAPPRRGRRPRSGSRGPTRARPGPGVLEAIAGADTVVVCPSNPVVSIDPLLAVPGVRRGAGRAAGTGRRGRLPDRGRCRAEGAGRPAAASRWASSRRWWAWPGGTPPGWRTLVIDEADADLAPAVEAEGVRCVVAPTIMSDVARSAALARVVLDAGD